MDAKRGLQRLDEIALEEYKQSLADSLAVDDEKLSVRRLARLTGIELKRPFANSREISGWSETGASREWIFDVSLLLPNAAGSLPLDGLKGNRSYRVQFQVYQELRALRDPIAARDFGNFLRDTHSESNWFLSLLRAAQPYLCDKSPKQKALWDAVSTAAEDLATRAVDISIGPVIAAVCSLIPFLAGAPAAVVAGFSLFLIHYAKKGYCKAEIQAEVVQTLGLRDLS